MATLDKLLVPLVPAPILVAWLIAPYLLFTQFVYAKTWVGIGTAITVFLLLAIGWAFKGVTLERSKHFEEVLQESELVIEGRYYPQWESNLRTFWGVTKIAVAWPPIASVKLAAATLQNGWFTYFFQKTPQQ